MASAWGGSWGTSWGGSWGATAVETPGLRRRKHAAERLARRRIKTALETLETIAAESVTAKTVAKAEKKYEEIRVEIASLPDISRYTFMIEAARKALATIKAADALKRLRAEEEWLLLT
jgi:hypothetical protein